jgi:hypothetical protein
MFPAAIRDIAKGEFLKRTECAKSVYIRGEYVRERKAFECYSFDDINKFVYIKADKTVYVDFTF